MRLLRLRLNKNIMADFGLPFFILQRKIKTKKSVKRLYKEGYLCYNSNRKILREKGGAYSAEGVSDFGERYYI